MSLFNLIFGSDNQGKKKLNINKLVNSDDIKGSIVKLDEYICNLCESGNSMDSLSDPQKIFYNIQCFEKEINNGGLKKFYNNSSGDFAHETCYSLKIISAHKTAGILKKANDLFPGKTVPKDRSERQKIVVQIQDSSDEVWKVLDQEFREYKEDINALTMEFIKKNKAFF